MVVETTSETTGIESMDTGTVETGLCLYSDNSNLILSFKDIYIHKNSTSG